MFRLAWSLRIAARTQTWMAGTDWSLQPHGGKRGDRCARASLPVLRGGRRGHLASLAVSSLRSAPVAVHGETSKSRRIPKRTHGAGCAPPTPGPLFFRCIYSGRYRPAQPTFGLVRGLTDFLSFRCAALRRAGAHYPICDHGFRARELRSRSWHCAAVTAARRLEQAKACS